ncbi:MAG: ATP-binding cassette domain-containing protein [Lachnospiraceae bacterium]|nr:ATP-binding cassette domain-containing protein [Lachnospiraceae bacterium]
MKIENITKTFDGKVVLKNLNMEIPEGCITCIMAPSGAGKTTLLRILMGLEDADSGIVTGLAGKRISAVFQEERLCEQMTAVENILLVTPSLAVQTIRQELGKLGLGADDGQPVSELSGGMRRRVSILRALLAPYDVVFLDEPFKGFDYELKVQVMAYVRERTTGKTVIVVTHDIQEAFALDAGIIELRCE